MNSQYKSVWWKAKVPGDWDTNEDDVCVTFKSQRWSGAIQVSAAIKAAAQVTDADLRELADQRIANRQVKIVTTAKFEGIHVEYLDNDNFWREWWLRSGNLMVYITYNVEKQLQVVERATIEEFINGLEPLSK